MKPDLSFPEEDLRAIREEEAAAPPPGSAEIPGPGAGEAGQSLPPEQMAELAIKFTEDYLAERGLSPLNPVQKLLLHTGIVGTAKKYNITFDLEKWPEISLAAGALWVITDKTMELRKQQAKQEKHPPVESAAPPPDASGISGPAP